MKGRQGRRILAGAVAAWGLLLAAGCGGGPAARPSGSAGAPAAAGPGAAAGTGPAHVVASYAQPSVGYLPLYVAVDRGFFRQEGLDVKLVRISGTNEVGALNSGELQFIVDGAPLVARANAAGVKLVMVAALENNAPFALYVPKEVRAAQDLAGKKVAIPEFGSTADAAARIILDHYGVLGEVQVVQVGGNMQNVAAALEKGTVSGGLVTPPTSAVLDSQGFHKLTSTLDLGTPLAAIDVDVTRSYLQQHRDTVTAFVKGILRAWAYLRDPANEAQAEQALIHYTNATDQQAKVAYAAQRPVWEQDRVPRVDERGVESTLRFGRVGTPVRAADITDNGIIDQLQQAGFTQQLGL